MFFTPHFGGCKYTNYFLFINKIIVFQCFDLLITCTFQPKTVSIYDMIHVAKDFFDFSATTR